VAAVDLDEALRVGSLEGDLVDLDEEREAVLGLHGRDSLHDL